MYPDINPDFKYAGIFVKEQLDEMNKLVSVDCDLFVINGFKSKMHYLFGSLIALYKVIFGRYDVIHAHYGLSALFTLLVPFKKWKNVVLTLHGGDILDKQGKNIQVMLTKRVLKKVGVVITLNDEMNKVVSKFRDDYVVQPCGVDTEFFFMKDSPPEIIASGRKILFPGNPEREVKNYPLFKSIIEAYNARYEQLEITILDGLTRDGVREAMQGSLGLLMTSISEGSPQAVKEAMSCDLAIVSSNVGDVEYVTGGVAGTAIFGTEHTPEEIAEKLHQALDQVSSTRGERRNRILSMGLSNTTVTKNLFKLYERIQKSA